MAAVKKDQQVELTLPEKKKEEKPKKERKPRAKVENDFYQISKIVPYTTIKGKKAANEILALLGDGYVSEKI